jgi:hypothetical protein
MFQMCGVFAEFERAMIVGRVNSGLARAKAKGVKLGRGNKKDSSLMKAWRLERFGGALTLEDVPVPKVRAGAVLIRIEASPPELSQGLRRRETHLLQPATG